MDIVYVRGLEVKTTIGVYSLRAREHQTVSTPVKWEEVEHCLKKKDAKLLVFEADEVLKRVDKMGDLFEALPKLKQKLPKLPGLEKEESQAPKTSEGMDLAAQVEKKPAKRKKKTR